MKKRFSYIVIILFSANFSFAQRILSANLVMNPGFEQYTHCPDNGSQIPFAYPWEDCLGGGGSSDYFNYCSTDQIIIQFINIQPPRTGNGEAGIYMYGLGIQDNYREYIMGVLTESLKKSSRYCGKFYASLFNTSKGAVEEMGIYFSKDTVYNNSGLFALQPQIENHNGIIKDTANWVKINGSFIANGGEKYLTIGNFKDNTHTNYIDIPSGAIGPYYSIDDVSVCECSFEINLGLDAKLCEGDRIILNPDLPNATYTWQDSSHTATYEVKQPGTYWVRAYVAEYDITTSDTIVISAEDEKICNPPLIIPNFITPNWDGNNDNFQLGNADKYDISLQIYNRWGNLIYQTANYQNDFICSQCADGVYYYLLSAKSKRNGLVKEYKGSLTVVK
ncbi:MAG: gliding motility-associated C-terminal domain-containing protein [Bacteroidales bacterium]